MIDLHRALSLLSLSLLLIAMLFIAMVDSLPYLRLSEIPGWVFLFGLPHILSSMLTFADKRYLEYYKPKLILGGVLFILMPAIAFSVNTSWLSRSVAILDVATMYHVVSQQCGIANAFAKRPPSVLFNVWRWCAILLGAASFLRFDGFADTGDFLSQILMQMRAVEPILACLMILAGVKLSLASQDAFGRYMVVVTTLIFGLSLLIFNFEPGIALIAVVILRLQHDITAYFIYINHDHSRNLSARYNFLYRGATWLPAWILNPMFSPTINAAILGLIFACPILAWIVPAFSIFHYYFEGFVWKAGSPHREHISLR